MSEISPPRRVLHLLVNGFAVEKTGVPMDASNEFFPLTETTAREALDKIFASEAVAVWSEL